MPRAIATNISKTTILTSLVTRGHTVIKSLSQVQHMMEYNGQEYFLIVLSKARPGTFNNLKRLEHCVDQRHLDAAIHLKLPAYVIVLETMAQRVLIGNLNAIDIRSESINNCWVNSFARCDLKDITTAITGTDVPLDFEFNGTPYRDMPSAIEGEEPEDLVA